MWPKPSTETLKFESFVKLLREAWEKPSTEVVGLSPGGEAVWKRRGEASVRSSCAHPLRANPSGPTYLGTRWLSVWAQCLGEALGRSRRKPITDPPTLTPRTSSSSRCVESRLRKKAASLCDDISTSSARVFGACKQTDAQWRFFQSGSYITGSGLKRVPHVKPCSCLLQEGARNGIGLTRSSPEPNYVMLRLCGVIVLVLLCARSASVRKRLSTGNYSGPDFYG